MAIFGEIKPPAAIENYESLGGGQGGGLFVFISNIFKLTVIIGGLFLVFQLITAGYLYLSANGDTKKTEQAWAKIWQAILGFAILASAFVIAAIVGKITGIDILNPTVYGPQ